VFAYEREHATTIGQSHGSKTNYEMGHPYQRKWGQCEMKEKMGQRENGADRRRWKRGKK
jgi:hypothetical protein